MSPITLPFGTTSVGGTFGSSSIANVGLGNPLLTSSTTPVVGSSVGYGTSSAFTTGTSPAVGGNIGYGTSSVFATGTSPAVGGNVGYGTSSAFAAGTSPALGSQVFPTNL